MMQTSAAREMETASSLDLEAFEKTPLESEPFDHVVVPGFLKEEMGGALDGAFPEIARGGSFAADSLPCDAIFANFLNELRGPSLTRAMETKFGIDLSNRPVMVTLRGQSRAKDGRIHTDSKSKLITALLYMNADWDDAGGRLRLLRGAHDLEDYAAEVAPERGTLLAFRCAPNAYHGHTPFTGARRSIQINWMTDEAVKARELARHGFSAWTKKLLRPLGVSS